MLLSLLVAISTFVPDAKDPRQRMLAAIADEIGRAQQGLTLRGHEAPYFISTAVRGIETREVGAKYGALFLDHVRHDRRLQVDVRVGSYEFDNSSQQELFDFDGQETSYAAGH